MSFNDDDFADFQNCTFAEDKIGSQNCLNNENEDFADFQNANLILNSNSNNQNLAEKSNNKLLTSNFDKSPKLEKIFNDAFPTLEKSNNDPNLDFNQSTNLTKDLFIDDYKKSLWNQIQNLEESPSLKLKWNKTQSFQNFLSALRVNPKNSLNNQHVPIFASSLGLLEPIKLKPNSTPVENLNDENKHISSNHFNSRKPKEINSKNLSTNKTMNTDSLSVVKDKNLQLKSISLNSLSNTNLKSNDLANFDSLNQKDKSNKPINGLVRPNLSFDKIIMNIEQLPDNQKNNELNLDTNNSNNKILDELPILNFMRSNNLMFNQ